MKIGIRKFFVCIIFLMLPLFLLGQTTEPPVTGPTGVDPGGPGDDERIPITETIILLTASGIGLGIKAFSKKKKLLK